MDRMDRDNLHDRVDRLERELVEIKQLLKKIVPETIAPSAGRPEERLSTPPPPPPPQRPPMTGLPPIRESARQGFELPEYMRKSEFWLSRVGIGLLLFGLVFAFKYSIDQGWITPPVRHFFGIGTGIVLFIFGWRLYAQRRHLSRLLLGGSIATFYITAFSAYQLFELISHPTAFALMVIITCLAFFISLSQDDALFSIIGTLGGLGTPFLLYTGAGNVPGLIGYTCLILAGTIAVYFVKGWRFHLWLSAVGGWIVMLIGVDAAESLYAQAQSSAQFALQTGALFTWLGFGALPTVRKILKQGQSVVADASGRNPDSHLHVLILGSPLVALAVSMQVWPETPDRIFGWMAFAAAFLYWFVAWLLRRLESVKSLSFTYVVTGTILLTLALCLLLKGDTLYLALAAEALGLHLLAQRLNDQLVLGGANLLSLIVGVWLMVHLIIYGNHEPAFLNRLALCDLIVILIGGVVALTTVAHPARRFYGLVAHLAFLAWLTRELHGLDNGQGYLSIAWGIYGALLLVIALRRNLAGLRWTGLATLMLVVLKLFLVDLAELETIWRVLLFMGFGAIFLLLSYYFPKLWKGEHK
jgi:uncharacterized membrane protein